MIMLVGPKGWVISLKHTLGDRTSHKGRVVSHTQVMEGALRGYTEHVEIVVCSDGYTLSSDELRAISKAEQHNTILRGRYR